MTLAFPEIISAPGKSDSAFVHERLSSPIGPIGIVHDGRALRVLDFHDDEDGLRRLLFRSYGGVRLEAQRKPSRFRRALEAYFDGELHALDKLPVETIGTPFQKRVWQALRDIPVGETISYKVLAERIGQPQAMRAVGHANGQNPVGIVVPCHRVIAADGTLGGFGGGLPRKRWLLQHERRNAEPMLFEALRA